MVARGQLGCRVGPPERKGGAYFEGAPPPGFLCSSCSTTLGADLLRPSCSLGSFQGLFVPCWPFSTFSLFCRSVIAAPPAASRFRAGTRREPRSHSAFSGRVVGVMCILFAAAA